jgi:hypothetical protein
MLVCVGERARVAQVVLEIDGEQNVCVCAVCANSEARQIQRTNCALERSRARIRSVPVQYTPATQSPHPRVIYWPACVIIGAHVMSAA